MPQRTALVALYHLTITLRCTLAVVAEEDVAFGISKLVEVDRIAKACFPITKVSTEI